MTYQVGTLTDPRPTDPKFPSEREAIEHAHAVACRDPVVPIAVWDERFDVVTLFLCGEEFKRV